MNSVVAWQRSDQFVGTQIENSFVILSLEASSYFAFNSSANDIWELLGEPKTVEQIVQTLTEKYDIGYDGCLQSVVRLIDELRDKGLVKSDI